MITHFLHLTVAVACLLTQLRTGSIDKGGGTVAGQALDATDGPECACVVSCLAYRTTTPWCAAVLMNSIFSAKTARAGLTSDVTPIQHNGQSRTD
ncbi:hypothetical protein BKA83DRAFT_4276876 [Pisolithus microcarpus]|nr:hypothetical protein BKA83DRAFT_4276876 [Pisolithus microcarpus]